MWYPSSKKTHFYSHAGLLFCLFFILFYIYLKPWCFYCFLELSFFFSPCFGMAVKAFDLQTCTWSFLKTYGKPPVFIYLYLYFCVCIKSHCKTQWWAWNLEINILSYSCFTGITWGSICVPCWRWLGDFWGTRCKENSLEWPAHSWPRNNDLGWDWCHVRYNWQLQKHKQYLFFIFWLFERIGKFC